MTQSAGLKIAIATIMLAGIWSLGHRHFIEDEKTWQSKQSPAAQYLDYVNDLRIKFAHQIQSELALTCSGDSGRMHEQIEEIGFGFTAYRRATVQEARALQLYITDQLVKAVNSYEKLAPFLEERPFTYKRASVSISFRSPYGVFSDGSVIHSFNVSELAVEENQNKLFYYAQDAYTGKHQEIFSEHHEEAIQRAAESPIPILKLHQTTPLEEAIDAVLPRYGEEMQKKYLFECESIGGKMDQQVEDIGVQFVLRKRTTHEEARQYMVKAASKLLETLNSNEKLQHYLAEFPFPSNRLKIRIRFAKQNYYTYSDESVASVSLENNEIAYYTTPPPVGDVYVLGQDVFAKESYEKALEKAAQ